MSSSSLLLSSLNDCLQKRKDEGLLRQLTLQPDGCIDFCSNDYLGMSRSKSLAKEIEEEFDRCKCQHFANEMRSGSTGSRLLSGNYEYYEEVESYLRGFYQGESALLFNSGFDLNLGLFGALPQPGDIVIFDELMHNSVREGIKISRGSSIPFKHNDCSDLERVLLESQKTPAKNIIVSVESVYSMDGHVAPLKEMLDICEKFHANLVVDEAHGVGVYGPSGAGMVSELGLQNRVFCRVCTFGKGPGVHGAVLIGPSILREYMINYCRPFIYSTAMPVHAVSSIMAAHKIFAKEGEFLQSQLTQVILAFQKYVIESPLLAKYALESPSAIQGIVVPGNENVVEIAKRLKSKGWWVLPIRSPTVPKNTERLRIILHVHNTVDQVRSMLHDIEVLLPEFVHKI